MTAETEQHYLADRDDYLNFANTNSWRSIDKSYRGKFSLKISPVDNQPMPQPQKVSMFRLPIRKGEKWSAKVWAFKALNSGMKSPTTVAPPNPPQKGGLKTGLLLVTPIIIPNLGNQSTENQGLSFNVLAAVPIVKSIFKGLKPVKAPALKLPEIAIEDADFVTESTGTAYLLVELLDDKNNVINPEVAKLYVNSQGIWEPLATEKTVDFGNECTQAGILRFSLVNDTDYNVWFDDFEITHKQSDEKINITSWTDYYPYGKVAKTSCPLNGAYRYGYQGEFAEKDSETDWNSFELRQYDSEIGRWLSTDPYGQYHSPYMAMGNDPSNRVDADGGVDDIYHFSDGSTCVDPRAGADRHFYVDFASSTISVMLVDMVTVTNGAWAINPNAKFDQAEFGQFASHYANFTEYLGYGKNNDNYSNEALSSFNDDILFPMNNFQCSSVPTYLLIKYSQAKGLPLVLKIDETRALDARKNSYEDFMSGFRSISTKRIASFNAIAIDPNNALAGDLMLTISTGGANHSRLIYARDGDIVSWVTASGGCKGGCTYTYPFVNAGLPRDTYRFNVFNK